MSSRLFVFVSVLMAFVCWAALSVAGDPPVGWWKCSEIGSSVVLDHSGNGNHGTLSGSAAVAADPDFGSVLSVEAPSGKLLIPASPLLEPPVGTIQIWVQPSGAQNSDVVVKLTTHLLRSNLPAGVIVLGLRLLDRRAYGLIANDDPALESPHVTVMDWNRRLQPRHWHHLALRWDGQTLALFIDGHLAISAPYLAIPGAGLSYSNTGLCLGCPTYWGQPSVPFTGRLADFRLYAYPRPDADIEADYHEMLSRLRSATSHDSLK